MAYTLAARDLSSLPWKDGAETHMQTVTNSLPEQSTAEVRSAHGATPRVHGTSGSSGNVGQELLPLKEGNGHNEHAKR